MSIKIRIANWIVEKLCPEAILINRRRIRVFEVIHCVSDEMVQTAIGPAELISEVDGEMDRKIIEALNDSGMLISTKEYDRSLGATRYRKKLRVIA